MWAITTLKELDFLEREKAIVSVLLAENYDSDLIDWISASWQDLHSDSGMNWHIAVPCHKNIEPSKIYEFSQKPAPKRYSDYYDSGLARKIMRLYGLNNNHSPVLLFDDFNESRHQRYISLSEFSKADLRRIFKSAAAYIEQLPRPPFSDAKRSQYSDELLDIMIKAHAGNKIIKLAPQVFSIVGAARRLMS